MLKHIVMQKIKIGLVVLLLLTFSSCELVGDIFQAGVSVGMFIVIAIIVLVIFAFAKLFGGRK